MPEAEIAELAIGPLDCQDRHAAREYAVAPSTLARRAWPAALWRARRRRPVGGRRDPHADDPTPCGVDVDRSPVGGLAAVRAAHRHGGRGPASP
jgi:hypothetical protein